MRRNARFPRPEDFASRRGNSIVLVMGILVLALFCTHTLCNNKVKVAILTFFIAWTVYAVVSNYGGMVKLGIA